MSLRSGALVVALVLGVACGTRPLLAQNPPAPLCVGCIDSVPPEIELLLPTGDVSVEFPLIRILFCDDSSLNASSRWIKVNGVTKTSSFDYVTGGPVDCLNRKTSSTTSVPLNPGVNSVQAHICDNRGNCSTETFAVNRLSVTVTPDDSLSTKRVEQRGGYSDVFTVTNTSGQTDTYALACVGVSGVTCAGAPSPSSVPLAAGAWATVTASYSVGTPGTGRLTVTATGTAVPGAVDSGSYVVPIVPRAVAVRPELPERQNFAATAGSQRFFVKNLQAVPATYNLSAVCSGTTTGCAVAPTSVTLAPSESRVAALSYTVGAAGTVGSGIVKAIDAGSSGLRDSAFVSLTSVAALFPVVSIVDANPGTTLERDLCLTISAGSEGAFECGDLRIIHPLPAIRTLNKPRVPTLLYNSAAADPYPIVAATVTLATGSPVPDSVEAVLKVGGVTKDSGRWAGTDWIAGGTRRIALRATAVGDTTATLDTTKVVDYTLEVATIYIASSRNGTAVAGRLIVVNRRRSSFGAGWWLAGLERLAILSDSSRLWVGGDGSARVYAPGGANVWVAPRVDRPDTLKRIGTAYVRRLPGGVSVWFNSAGQHDSTVNRLGHRTGFAYTSGRLTTITLPSQGGGQTYAFGYDGNSKLVSVTAPGGRVTMVRVSAQRVDSIRDPDNSRVQFSYESPSSRRIATRADRRGTVTTYNYDDAKKLSRAHITLPGDSIRVGFRATDVQGFLTATPKTATDTASVYTSFFGARQFTTGPNFIAQETKVWLDRYGAPRRIVNPLGQQTLVKREDGEWSTLATEVTAVNGFVTRAGYDGRGNMARTTAVNPLGDPSPGPEDDAITRYHWNSTWDFADSVVTPTGVTTTMAYDPTNGNRLWQQVGSDAARRITFAYYASGPEAGLLRATKLPDVPGGGTARDSVVYSAGLVNLAATRTPRGFWTSYYKDGLGRDTLVVTPIDSTDLSRGGAADSTIRTRQRTVYTVADRDSISETIAPNRVQTVLVEKSHDLEGNVLLLRRSSSPDSALIGTITTRWRYDAANRAVAEIAPDDAPANPRVDSTEYDPAGNAVKALTRRNNPIGGARLTVTMTYDALNRLIQRALPAVHYGQRLDGIPFYQAGSNVPSTPYPMYPNDGGTGYLVPSDVATFTYDVSGGVRTANNGAAQIARGYYPNSAIKADTQRIRTVSGSDFDQHKYVLQYTYDLDGRRVDLIHPSQLAAGAVRDRTTNAYDASTGLPASVTDVMGNVFQLGYDLRGQVTSLTSPGGITESDEYDGDGQLRVQRLLNGSTSAFKWPESYLRNASYAYDARGKVIRAYNTAGTADTLLARYSGLGHVVLDSMRTRGQASVLWGGGIGPFPINFDTWETFSLDALGNIRQANTSTRVWNGPANERTIMTLNVSTYLPGVGRLTRQTHEAGRRDTLVYDEAGNTVWMSTLSNSVLSYQDRASYYGADGKVVAADWRSVASPANRFYFEESRYDALGRRVWVRSRNSCLGAGSEPLCKLSKIRRIVWDGDHELYEIQMPGADTDGVWLENDVAQVQLPVVVAPENGLRYDRNPYFGRVAYTSGLAIDQPLSVSRFGYRSVMGQNGDSQPALDWAPFTLMPRWTIRGMADIGTFSDGGVDRCVIFQSVTRCIWVDWPAQVYAYARTSMRRNAWHGSVTEDKADAAGTYHRRNRQYDPQTGRFTQEDPIGLAGGLNLYGFADGDPVNFDDPFGLCPPCDIQTLVAGAAGAVANWWGGLSQERREILAWSLSQSLAAVAEEHGARSGRRLGTSVSSSPRITSAYRRPSGATTAAQRAYVQGQACVRCGASADKMVAGHKQALVQEYYEAGSIDTDRMRSLNAVQPECAVCSSQEGARMSAYSKLIKKQHGLQD